MTIRQVENKQGTLRYDPSPVVRAMAIRGLTLQGVCDLVGGACSINAVWRITNGKVTRPGHLHAVCKVLGVKVADCYPLPEDTSK